MLALSQRTVSFVQDLDNIAVGVGGLLSARHLKPVAVYDNPATQISLQGAVGCRTVVKYL